MFDTPGRLALGLAMGFVFGFLLQKGRAAKFSVIVGQLLLKDWTVVKIMLTAVAVGAVGVYALVAFDLAALHIKPAAFGGVIFGGVLFGVGLAVFGLCPGTSVAACGEGQRDAMVGVVGMLFGAGVYVALFPWVKVAVDSLGSWGKVTIADVTETPSWLWIAAIVAAAFALWRVVGQRHGPNVPT